MKSGGQRSSKKKKRLSPSTLAPKQRKRGTVSKKLKHGKIGKESLPQSDAPAPKKIGDVKITLKRVNDTPPSRRINLPSPSGNCPCGKTFQQCDDEWDSKLGITSRSAEAVYGAPGTDKKYSNLGKMRLAETAGEDPYHQKMRRKAERGGQEPEPYRPYMPPGSFSVPH